MHEEPALNHRLFEACFNRGPAVIVKLLHLPAKPRIIPRSVSMVSLIGPLATANRESRQARKGATVAVTLCAEVWLLGVIAISPSSAPVISL